MKQSQLSFVGLASIALVTISSFAACGGLDPRKVSRGPDYAAGGDDATGGSSGPSAGGSDSKGGEPTVNPFGGNFDLGGAPPVVDGPPEVVEVDPVDGATDVDVNTSISFRFSEAVNADTVTVDSVTVSDSLGPIAGDVTLNQDVIGTFEPPRRLALATTYTTSVSTGVTDTTGQPLKEAFSSTFTTRDGEWDVNKPFVADPAMNWNYYSQASVATDARGNALLLWIQNDGLWARWHRQATGWQPAQRMSAEGVYINSGYEKMAVSPDGEAIVVWPQYDDVNARYEIMSRRFVGGAWNEAPEIATGTIGGTGMQYNPQGVNVAFRGGHIIVWWTYYLYNSPNYSYYLVAQTTTADGAWQMYPQGIASAYSTTRYLSGYASIGMDSAGNAMLVHNLADAMTNLGQLYFSKYVAATGEWESAAELTGAANLDPYSTIAVALDEAGAAVVAWPSTAMPYDLVVSRYTKAKGFSMPKPVDDLDTSPQILQQGTLTSDGSDFVVAWRQPVGSTYNVYSSRYSTAEAAWSPAELLSDGDTSVSGLPVLGSDSRGNSMVAWVHTNSEVRFARWLRNTGAWTTGVVVDGNDSDPVHTYNPYAISMAVSANGIVNLLLTEADYSTAQPLLNVFQ